MIDVSALKTEFADRPLAVLGLGRTGLAAVKACQAAGISVLAWDDNAPLRKKAESLGAKSVDFATEGFADCAALILSPGIPHSFPVPHTAVLRAREENIPVIGDFELFARTRPQAKIIAVTGTNGKSTTTALIGHVLKTAQYTVAVGGNLGDAVLSLPVLDADGFYVLEMSSYQLELCPSFASDVAILANISEDHIARHGDLAGYIAAKENIFVQTAQAVIGMDDVYTQDIATRHKDAICVKVGTQSDVFVQGGALYDQDKKVCDLRTAASLPGVHNAQNAALAYAALRALNIPAEDIIKGFESFPGLAHRQQIVATINGVRYINDSKGTNVEATARALACYDPIYWIAGGQPKDNGLSGLEKYMPRIRQAFLMGQAEDEFNDWLADQNVACQKCGTLDKAAQAAHEMAQQEGLDGAVVLLSPACASWDQFESFEHRGDDFAALAKAFANGRAA